MGLSAEKIRDLYAARTPRENKRVIRGRVWIRNGEGKLESRVIEKTGDYNFGGFEGRVGSVRRSRKGATRRLPNGRRRYIVPQDGEQVVAYVLTPQ